ncbi:30S ribosomal protein S13 [Candidatus Vidania fulgoroideorum]
MNIEGVYLIPKRYFYIEITKIFGIGKKKSENFCKKKNIYNKKVFQINKKEKKEIKIFIKKNIVGQELKKKIKSNISRLIRIKCYRGYRHLKKLPCRGQRTRTNARTLRK